MIISHKYKFIFISIKKYYYNKITPYVQKKHGKNTRGILVEKRKYIYFFIQKLASTSLKTVIAKSIGLDFKKNVHKAKFCFIEKEKTTLNIYNNYFKFAFVRNPWDRMVSCYKGGPEKHIYKEKILIIIYNLFNQKKARSLCSFEDFVESVCETSDETANYHFRSQSSFVTNSKGELIVDFIGKLENFDEDFKIVSKKTGLEHITIIHKNKSDRKHYSEYYNEKTREMIRERFKEDIERFGYQYEDLKQYNKSL